MNATIIDTRDGSQGVMYLDWPWSPEAAGDQNRFGHVRAEKQARAENARESRERFLVEVVVPKVGQRVLVDSYNRIRRGLVTEVRVGRLRARVRVRWYSASGVRHEHWYDPREFQRAQQLLESKKRAMGR